MTRAIVSGALNKAVEERTSKNGKLFATFTVLETVNGSRRYWAGVAFDEGVIGTLRSIKAGEPLAIAGAIDCELWKPEDCREPRLNWKIVADGILTAQVPAKAKPASGREAAAKSCASPAAGGVDDDIPF